MCEAPKCLIRKLRNNTLKHRTFPEPLLSCWKFSCLHLIWSKVFWAWSVYCSLCRLQNSPYFSARVGLNVALKGSGTSVKSVRGLSALRTSQFARRAQYLEKKTDCFAVYWWFASMLPRPFACMNKLTAYRAGRKKRSVQIIALYRFS